MSYENPGPPDMSISHALRCGTILFQLSKYMGKYSITFQFWGESNNNVFIEKGGVALYDSGGFSTPLEAMVKALEYLDRINRNKTEIIDQ